jgi:glutathione S-transferase
MTASGPNPWKVVLILEELSIPYDLIWLKFDDVKKKPFTDLNPNGRFPGTYSLAKLSKMLSHIYP